MEQEDRRKHCFETCVLAVRAKADPTNANSWGDLRKIETSGMERSLTPDSSPSFLPSFLKAERGFCGGCETIRRKHHEKNRASNLVLPWRWLADVSLRCRSK